MADVLRIGAIKAHNGKTRFFAGNYQISTSILWPFLKE